MERDIKIGIMIFIPLFVLFICWVFFTASNTRKENLSYDFKGVIEQVNYDVKGIPTIMINHKEYYLSAGYNFDHKIEKGDFLFKEKGSNIYKLKKSNSDITLEFKN